MFSLIFDIETNDLLQNLTKVHCIEAVNPDTDERYHFGPDDIEAGLKLLQSADRLIGHNIICFDLPALQKVYPWFRFDGEVRDTLNISRLIWTNLFDLDMRLKKKREAIGETFKFMGQHGLKAWGHRLGIAKGEYGEGEGDVWAKWSREMQDYCEQDVQVTLALWKLIISKNYSETAIALECDFQRWIHLQEQHGWDFNRPAAVKLYSQLSQRRQELEEEFQGLFPPEEVKTPFTPKANNKKLGYEKGVQTFKTTTVTFNPASDKQIGERLMERYHWKPTKYTPGGQPAVGEDVLADLPYPEVKPLLEYAQLKKIMGQLSEGKNAWLKVERDNKVFGGVTTNGAVTGRCTHKIIVNVPRVTSPFGMEMRSLMAVPDTNEDGEEYVLLGCDASGLELRCLAHYMARYDDGAYITDVTTGDVHTRNQAAAELDTRDEAKTFIYAHNYGAGDEKLGGGNRKLGALRRKKFMENLPALKYLVEAVKAKAKRDGHIVGLDGRIIYVQSQHVALNYLLQSAGTILVKKATVYFNEEMNRRYAWNREWAMVGHFHDEFQVKVLKRIAEEVGALAVECFEKAGAFFNFRCPITGEYKIGKNWAETH